MTPNFRAYDGSSLSRMYQPDEVMVGNGDIWIIDEDSVAGDWIVNNDLHLMQSTGLKDKNGKEVFIGDIIKCTRGSLHEVYLEKEYGGTFIGGMPAVYLKGLREGYAWTEDEEIIGNIYENPELLEVTYEETST